MIVWNDTGKVLPAHAQPVGGSCHVRKTLYVPSAAAVSSSSDLYVFADAAVGTRSGLRLTCNGEPAGEGTAGALPAGTFGWLRFPVPASALRPGSNVFGFTSDAVPGAWRLGVSASTRPGCTAVSPDNGRSWIAETGLGPLAAIPGEIIVRLRLENTRPDPVPPFIDGALTDDDRGRVLELLPDDVRAPDLPPPGRGHRLMHWVHRAVGGPARGGGPRYTPWNFPAIMQAAAENRRATTTGTPPPNYLVCVHCTVAFVIGAQALGLESRCVVTTERIHSTDGHFFAELRDPAGDAWTVYDPSCDITFAPDNGDPLRAVDLYPNRKHLPEWIRYGAGARRRRGVEKHPFIRDLVMTGRTYRNVGYWRRTDFLAHPEATPSSHGSITYCEPDIVWVSGDDPLLRAFPYDCRWKVSEDTCAYGDREPQKDHGWPPGPYP